MLATDENLRREYGIGRTEQDDLALRSQARASVAVADGRFDDEIVPVTVPGRTGPVVVSADETPRADSSLTALAGLRPILLGTDADATVNAKNASGQNDAAAACIVTTPERAAEVGLTHWCGWSHGRASAAARDSPPSSSGCREPVSRTG
ncbi:hypothetical protein [Cryobacterium sp. TMT1-19]|uniref:thiolase family protein n=1 Tax=Cryobacterium sp. TMT1-19 TaxID=1259231 RepID=UPI0021044535|nr:hypothetical protein [Cryobacterium sp. TMT1-19]